MKLLPVSEQPRYLKVLLYGEPGSGKTTFACSGSNHPHFAKTVIANIDDGTESVMDTDAMMTPPINSSAEFDDVLRSVATRARGWEDVKTLVIDSFSDFLRLIMDETIAKKNGVKPRLCGLNETHRDDYRDVGNAARRYGALIRSLPCNIIMIAHTADRKADSDGPVISITPDIAGEKAEKAVRGMFNNVWCSRMIPGTDDVIDKDGVVITPATKPYMAMLTRAKGLFIAKTRNARVEDLLPPVMKNPTLPQVFDIYTQALDGQKEPTP